MPSHKIHLAIAKKISDKFSLDLDSVMLGSVLPDICNEKEHQKPHFQVGDKDLDGLANPDKFVKKYRNMLSNPVMLGYVIHLLTDRFYNEYFFRHFYVYDQNDNGIGIYIKGKLKLLDGDSRKHLKHREMNIYDRWLMNHNYVYKFKNYDCIENVIDIEEATFNKERLKEYMVSANNDISRINVFSKFCFYNYKITNQREMDKIFDECIKYICDYLIINLKI